MVNGTQSTSSGLRHTVCCKPLDVSFYTSIIDPTFMQQINAPDFFAVNSNKDERHPHPAQHFK